MYISLHFTAFCAWRLIHYFGINTQDNIIRTLWWLKVINIIPVVEGLLSSGFLGRCGCRGPDETGREGRPGSGLPPPLSHQGRANSCCCSGGPRHYHCHMRSSWAGRWSEMEQFGCLDTQGHLEKIWEKNKTKQKNKFFSVGFKMEISCIKMYLYLS